MGLVGFWSGGLGRAPRWGGPTSSQPVTRCLRDPLWFRTQRASGEPASRCSGCQKNPWSLGASFWQHFARGYSIAYATSQVSLPLLEANRQTPRPLTLFSPRIDPALGLPWSVLFVTPTEGWLRPTQAITGNSGGSDEARLSRRGNIIRIGCFGQIQSH